MTLLLEAGYGQVCAGNLGDPVVNIDFSSGSTATGPALTSVSTNYTYTSSQCPDDGYYSVTSSTTACFTNTWHTITTDHTPGDQNGYMMLVNASSAPGVFYKQIVSGLCPNTTYEFAAWIVNVLKAGSLNPNITFVIATTDGRELKSYNTGDISATALAEWKQYGFLFNTANLSDVVLSIINNAPGGVGNDLALDDITFRPCGPAITPKATTNGKATALLCEGETAPVSLEADISEVTNTTEFQWQVNNNDGSGWVDIPGLNSLAVTATVYNAAKSGYQYRLSVTEGADITFSKCRVYSTSVTIDIIPRVTADAGPDKVTVQAQPVKLDAKATGNNPSYLWTPATYLDDPTSLTPVARPEEDITYTLQVTSGDGCMSTASDIMVIHVNKKLVINNTFSPNGDGINDTWNVIALNTYSNSVTSVYNRYGETIFTSKGYQIPWDGTYKGNSVPVGTYSYIIDLKNGSPKYCGWLLVVR